MSQSSDQPTPIGETRSQLVFDEHPDHTPLVNIVPATPAPSRDRRSVLGLISLPEVLPVPYDPDMHREALRHEEHGGISNFGVDD